MVRSTENSGDFPEEISMETLRQSSFMEKVKIDLPEKHQTNRKALSNMLVSDGWKWADIYGRNDFQNE